MSTWQIIRKGTFSLYWFPGVCIGVYKVYYDGWYFTINLGLMSMEWHYV